MTEVLQAKPEIIDRNEAISINNFKKIEFNNYTFSYPKTDLEILKGLNLNIISGKSLGIVGKTGSGKSTLIRQLLRRFPVIDDNSLKIDGLSINDYKKYDIRRLVSYVPQEHLLFARSVKDNILIGKIQNNSMSYKAN